MGIFTKFKDKIALLIQDDKDRWRKRANNQGHLKHEKSVASKPHASNQLANLRMALQKAGSKL